MTLNSFDYFLTALDKLDVEKREKILSWVNEIIIRPRYKESHTGKERMTDLRIDEVSYDVFKEKGRILADALGDSFLVCAIVNWLLQCLFDSSDTTAIDEKKDQLNSHIRFIEGIKRAYEGDSEGDAIGLDCYLNELRKRKEDAPYLSETDPLDGCDNIIGMLHESVTKIHERTNESYSLYEDFCEVVVSDLLIEKVFEDTQLSGGPL